MLKRYVPRAVRRRLRPLPQWRAVCQRDPQNLVSVLLMTQKGLFDVTNNHVVAALKPLTIAIGLDELPQRAIERDRAQTMCFRDLLTGRTVGELLLEPLDIMNTPVAKVGLFRVAGDRQNCVEWPWRPLNRWLQGRAARQASNPGNFSMSPAGQQQIMIFYICPRPVVLVSVDDGQHSNIFPMDLIGPLSPGAFALGLRSTSQSVEAMKVARRVALSDIAASDVKIALDLGKHHGNIPIDWSTLPFSIEHSEEFQLPVPSIALRVREFEVAAYQAIGSHTFFACRLVSAKSMRDDPQLFHTSGIYEYFRSCRGQPLTLAGKERGASPG